MALGGNDHHLADSQLCRNNSIVESQDLASSGSIFLSQVEESVARLDCPGANALADRLGADGNVDDLAGDDLVDVLDLAVGSNDCVKGDVEGRRDSRKSVP